MAFMRVRQAVGPAHEFDVAVATYDRNPDAYVVVDKTPVASPRPMRRVVEKPKATDQVVKSEKKEANRG